MGVGARQYITECRELMQVEMSSIPDNKIIVSQNMEPGPGLILDSFYGTVSADVVARVSGSPLKLGYSTVPHFINPDLSVLRYGAYGIYLAFEQDQLNNHKKIHQDLINTYKSDVDFVNFATIKKHLHERETAVAKRLSWGSLNFTS